MSLPRRFLTLSPKYSNERTPPDLWERRMQHLRPFPEGTDGHSEEKETDLMITTRTPLRISFFGGGTDYPIWFREFGGSVLSTVIVKSCYITCRHLPPFFEYHSRVSYSRIENVNQNSAIEHPSVRACLQFMGIYAGVEIPHVADLPARTGLGTSSAFTVGLLLGLYALRDQMRNKHALASDAIHVEQEVIKESVGSQDQVSAAYGGFNLINFLPDGSFDVKRVLTPQSRLAE